MCSNEFRCARSWEQHCCLLVTTLSITPHGLQCCCSSQIWSVAQWFEGVRHLKNLSTLHNRMFEFDYNSRTVHQFDQSNGVSLPTRQELLNEHNFELKKKKKKFQQYLPFKQKLELLGDICFRSNHCGLVELAAVCALRKV